MKEKYCIMTAIVYATGKPHIGNTYEAILADSFARYKRLLGYDVYFQTGTDEFGKKTEEKANDASITPQEFVDQTSSEVKKIWDAMNISYTKFIRTTDPIHQDKVSRIFKKLYDQGDIYKGEYNGKYCIPCESYFTESQLVEEKCPDCSRDVETMKEEAYFFKLSNYTDRLVEYFETHPDFIQPASRKNEMIKNFIEPGLQDLCVSRTSIEWGIPVTIDEGHVIYVWLDALCNYLTFLGYDPDNENDASYQKYWPADLQIIGKDILRFHMIYWPIILMALGEELPKKLFGHPWLLLKDGKMSKSKGNVVYADELAKDYSVDAVRYYMLHEIPFAHDGVFSYELMTERTNSDLANVLGNLVNRTMSMVKKYSDGVIYKATENEAIDQELINMAIGLPELISRSMDACRVSDSLTHIFELLRRSNKYIDETAPWVLAKDSEKTERLRTVLYNLLESIRFAGVMLQPYLPETSDKIFRQINTSQMTIESLKEFGNLETDRTINEPIILFQRIVEDDIAEK